MAKPFNPALVLDAVGGVLSIVVMAGLTLVGAATYAQGSQPPAAEIAQLPPVVMGVKRAAPVVQLPTVIVVGQHSTPSTSA